MKVLIFGSRHLKPSSEFIDRLLEGIEVTEIIEGECRGVDKSARNYALENEIPLTTFPANWKEHGKAAGPIRNRMMVNRCDLGIAIWDGSSKGTLNTINELKKANKPVRIHRM